jgi:hypothetical protein
MIDHSQASQSKNVFKVPDPHQFEEDRYPGQGVGSSSKTRTQTNPYQSLNGSTSKKRARDEISGGMSVYDQYVVSHQEARADPNDMQAKRIHAWELERHMKSKKQLYACLTLEGKTHSAYACFSPNIPATDWRVLADLHAADHEW